MPRPPFVYQSNTHSLAHLEPFVYTYIVTAVKNKPERRYVVYVEFTLHCFTKTQQATDDPALFYCFDRDGSPRSFNLERWNLSIQLPGIIRGLLTQRVHFTAERKGKHRDNFITVPLVQQNGSAVNYEVYFKVFKPGRKTYLEVESAYTRAVDSSNAPSLGRKIGFAVILQKIFNGEPLFKLR